MNTNTIIQEIDEFYNFSFSKDKAINYLYNIINNFNNSYSNLNSVDIINYEKIFFIMYQFSEDIEIQELCKKVVNIIGKNYLFKQKMLAKLTLNQNIFMR